MPGRNMPGIPIGLMLVLMLVLLNVVDLVVLGLQPLRGGEPRRVVVRLVVDAGVSRLLRDKTRIRCSGVAGGHSS